MYIQFVKFASRLAEDQVRRLLDERAPQYREVPGLVQKYYIREPATGAFGGVYLWDSEASYKAFRDSRLGQTISDVYETDGPPRTELFEVLFPLREGVPFPLGVAAGQQQPLSE
jgi:hypothetical protein